MMSNISVRIEGIDNLTAYLNSEPGRTGLRRGLTVVGARVLEKMKQYPPAPRAGHRGYRRTGTLARSWGMRARGLQVLIENKASYAGYVQGDKRRYFHKRTGWQTPDEVFEQDRVRIEFLLARELRRSR